MHDFIHETWLRTERQLLRERGIWGPPRGSSLDKYQLDMTEGPLRMRIKMEKNDEFYQNYPYRAKADVCLLLSILCVCQLVSNWLVLLYI